MRISHSHFLGGPNEWTQSDRDKAIWWFYRDQTRCMSCGTRPDEWDEDKGGDQWMYTAATVRCRGCEVMALMPDSEVESQGKGVRKYLRLNPPEKRRRYQGG